MNTKNDSSVTETASPKVVESMTIAISHIRDGASHAIMMETDGTDSSGVRHVALTGPVGVCDRVREFAERARSSGADVRPIERAFRLDRVAWGDTSAPAATPTDHVVDHDHDHTHDHRHYFVTNHTPHSVTLLRPVSYTTSRQARPDDVVGNDGKTYELAFVFDALGGVARCDEVTEELPAMGWDPFGDGGMLETLPLQRKTFGVAQYLPAPAPDRRYIVSQIVADACPDRDDLIVPSGIVRDRAGRVLGCTAFSWRLAHHHHHHHHTPSDVKTVDIAEDYPVEQIAVDDRAMASIIGLIEHAARASATLDKITDDSTVLLVSRMLRDVAALTPRVLAARGSFARQRGKSGICITHVRP